MLKKQQMFWSKSIKNTIPTKQVLPNHVIISIKTTHREVKLLHSVNYS